MFKKVLVPLDSSVVAERALETAMTLAEACGAELILLSAPSQERAFVHETGGYVSWLPPEAIGFTRQEMSRYLRTTAARWQRPGCNLRTEVIDGDAASVIVETAARERIDLIVMSTHGRSGFERWLLGSVTESVLRRSPAPVLALRSEKPPSNILITLDGSELAEQAVEPAVEIASVLSCQVTLMMVARTITVNAVDVSRLEAVERGLGKRLTMHLFTSEEAYLEGLIRRYEKRIEQEINKIVTEGPVAQRILEIADDRQVDLIAMSTHGRSGLGRWVYGSVTEKVVRGAQCNMLVVPPARRRL